MLRKIITTCLGFVSYAIATSSFADCNQGDNNCNHFTFIKNFKSRPELVYQLYDFTSGSAIATQYSKDRKVVLSFAYSKIYSKGHDIEATVCTPDSYDGNNKTPCYDVNHTTCPFPQYRYAVVHKLEGKYSLSCEDKNV